jgi:phage-related protein
MNKGMANIVIKAVDNATPTLKKVGKGFGALSKAGKAVGGGLQTAALGAIGIATAVAGFTVAATLAAANEEKQIARLNGVLKTRGMLTDANSAAVETQIGKLQDLAFSDDQVRESLITATAFTKNFNDALKIQNVAADVAAAKGISLEEATSLVGKAYQGNTKGLKGLGVQTKKGAKATDILAAVTKKYGGAAAAAANTVSGKLTRAQNTVNNIMEDFGAKFLPIASDGLEFLNKNVLPALASGLDALAPIVQDLGGKLVDTFGPMIQDNITNLTKPGGVFDSIGGVVGPIFDTLGSKVGDFIGKLTGPGGLLTALGDLAGTLWGDGKGPLAVAVQFIGGALGLLVDTIGAIAGGIAGLITAVNDFLTAFGKAADTQRSGAQDYYTRMGGGTVAPTYAPGTGVGTSYGAPSFKVYVGQKEFDATVKDSVNGMLRDTGR